MKQLLFLLLLVPALLQAQAPQRKFLKPATGRVVVSGSGGAGTDTAARKKVDSIAQKVILLQQDLDSKADRDSVGVPFTPAYEQDLQTLKINQLPKDSVRKKSELIKVPDIDPAAVVNVDVQVLRSKDKTTRSYQLRGSKLVEQTVGVVASDVISSLSLTDGRITYCALDFFEADTITGIMFSVATAGVYTADNNNKIGLYSYSGGVKTLVASSANDPNLFTTAGLRLVPFTAPVIVQPGAYYVAPIYNSSAQTTAPALHAKTNSGTVIADVGFTNSATLYEFSSGTDLPATISTSSTSPTNTRFWFAAYKQ